MATNFSDQRFHPIIGEIEDYVDIIPDFTTIARDGAQPSAHPKAL
jgi:hypothetical protein